MPELPEIETIRRKLEPKLIGHSIESIILKRSDLRFPIPKNLPQLSQNQKITSIKRRSKYLLIQLNNNQTIICHLGMSGRLFFFVNQN